MIYIQGIVFGQPLTLCYLGLENNFYDLENERSSPHLEANDFDLIFIIAENIEGEEFEAGFCLRQPQHR
jgi:hypothetical protein